jgi:hypothetical protein
MTAALAQAPRAALAGLRDAHGGATPCPVCGFRGHTARTERELERNPVGTVRPEVLMQHLGHAAAEAEGEAEAEAFVGALVPLAARLVPRAAPAIMRTAPQLIRGVSRLTRTLRRNPRTRPLVRVVPTVVRNTARTLARQSARGRPVTPQRAVRVLARQTDRVLGDPQARRMAVRQSVRMDRRFHQAACPHVYPVGATAPAAGPARSAGGCGCGARPHPPRARTSEEEW